MSAYVRPLPKRLFVLGGLGVVLLTCILQSEYLLTPQPLELLGALVYRIAFFIILPLRTIVRLFIPSVDHHWPLSHFVVCCLGTPFFLYGIRNLVRHTYRTSKVRRLQRRPAARSGHSIDRRQFLARSAAGVVGVATAGFGSYASVVEPARLMVRTYEIPIPNLPDGLDGIRLVHVSDTHYGPFVPREFLNEAVARANDLAGDLVVLTGDYVHFTPRSVQPGIELLSGLRARLGVVGVLGNHEHWEGAQECRDMFRQIRVPLVDNGRLFLTPGGLASDPAWGRSLCIAGVGDLWEDEVSFEKALGGVHPAIPRIVLSHNPDTADLLDSTHRVDLMLSGHTHGGQVRLPGLRPRHSDNSIATKYLGGQCQANHCTLVVSRGIGMAFMPVRFGVPPELAVIALRKA